DRTSTAIERMAARMVTLDQIEAAAPWRSEIAALQTRLAETGSATAPDPGLVHRLDAVEAAAVAHPWREELAHLAGEVAQSVEALSARLDGLTAPVEGREPAALESRLADAVTSLE